jgi:hypothetical protein
MTNNPTVLQNNLTVIATQDIQKDEIRGVIEYYRSDHPQYADGLQAGIELTEEVEKFRRMLTRLEEINRISNRTEQTTQLKNLLGKEDLNLDDFKNINSIQSTLFRRLVTLNEKVAALMSSLLKVRADMIDSEGEFPIANITIIPVNGFFVDPSMINEEGNLPNEEYYRTIEPSVIIKVNWNNLSNKQQVLIIETLASIRREFSQYGALIQFNAASSIATPDNYHHELNAEPLGDSIEGVYKTEEVVFEFPDNFELLEEAKRNFLMNSILSELSSKGFLGGTILGRMLMLTYVPKYEKDEDGKIRRKFSVWYGQLEDILHNFQRMSGVKGKIFRRRKLLVHYDEYIDETRGGDRKLASRMVDAQIESKQSSQNLVKVINEQI